MEAVSNRFKISDKDWICNDQQCANINFARRRKCNRCNKNRTDGFVVKEKIGQEIGKALAEKSRGLFSAEDWHCNKCGNVNWARRQQCNMCNAPKFVEIEERTGIGGGYNDRVIVEYKKRDESDNEYDEFGRKRKKKKVSNSNDGNSKCDGDERYVDNTSDLDEDDDDEGDEEEEDDDDDDLSKYDLSEWGDEPTNNQQDNECKNRTDVAEVQHSQVSERSRTTDDEDRNKN